MERSQGTSRKTNIMTIPIDSNRESLRQWKVIVASRDRSWIESVSAALAGKVIYNRSLLTLSAASGEALFRLLFEHPDAAVVLLDDENGDGESGASIAERIRRENQAKEPRIIIRMEDGAAPLSESEMESGDVRECRMKSEMPARRLPSILVAAIRDFRKMNRHEIHSERSEAILSSAHRFVPHEFMNLLNKETILDVRRGDQIRKEMTILFADIRGYSEMAETMTTGDAFEFLNRYLGIISPVIRSHRGFINQYYGDGIMALFPDKPEDGLQAAISMQETVRVFNERLIQEQKPPIHIGIGLHTGPVVLGFIGDARRMDGTVVGNAVNMASHLENLTKEYGCRTIMSETVLRSLPFPDRYGFRVLDLVALKGKQAPVSVIEVLDGDDEEERAFKLVTRGSFDRALHCFNQGRSVESIALFRRVLDIHPDDRAAARYLERAISATRPANSPTPANPARREKVAQPTVSSV